MGSAALAGSPTAETSILPDAVKHHAEEKLTAAFRQAIKEDASNAVERTGEILASRQLAELQSKYGWQSLERWSVLASLTINLAKSRTLVCLGFSHHKSAFPSRLWQGSSA